MTNTRFRDMQRRYACDPEFKSRWVYSYRECIGLMLSQLSLSDSMEGLAIAAPDDSSSSINFGHAEVLMNDNGTSTPDQLNPALFLSAPRCPFDVCSSLGFLFLR